MWVKCVQKMSVALIAATLKAKRQLFDHISLLSCNSKRLHGSSNSISSALFQRGAVVICCCAKAKPNSHQTTPCHQFRWTAEISEIVVRVAYFYIFLYRPLPSFQRQIRLPEVIVTLLLRTIKSYWVVHENGNIDWMFSWYQSHLQRQNTYCKGLCRVCFSLWW